MTERFNFYDIYGYLIPGLTFVTLLWVPFAIMSPEWPDFEWSSAFVALIAAYVTGFLVNRLTAPFVRVSLYDARTGKYRRPGDLLLDPPMTGAEGHFEQRLSERTRVGVIEGIQQVFEVDVRDDTVNRQDAFFLCRRLLQMDAPWYSEQFEGMYTLCATLAAVLLVISYYFVGWVLSQFVAARLAAAALFLLAVLFCGSALHHRYSRYSVLVLPPALLFIGVLAAIQTDFPPTSSALLLGLAIGAAVFSVPFYTNFRYFSYVFTTTVYRDFYVLTRTLSGENRHDRRTGHDRPRG